MASSTLNTRRGVVALVLLALFVLSFISEVNAVKSVYLSPRAQQRRRERRRELVERTVPRSAPVRTQSPPRHAPASRQAPSHPPVNVPAPISPRSKITIPSTLREKSLHGHDHRALANRLHSRQVNAESCNNITVTPPGWDGSCSEDDPCPNGACWCVPICTVNVSIHSPTSSGASGFCGYGVYPASAGRAYRLTGVDR